MNSIRRPRMRPRVRSTNWRTFAWLVEREAYLRIVNAVPHCAYCEKDQRQYVARARPDGMRRASTNLLKVYPERRFYYGP